MYFQGSCNRAVENCFTLDTICFFFSSSVPKRKCISLLDSISNVNYILAGYYLVYDTVKELANSMTKKFFSMNLGTINVILKIYVGISLSLVVLYDM